MAARDRDFEPGAVDYDGRMASSFDAGRALAEGTRLAWERAVRPYAPEQTPRTVLDLGSGTGRFSQLLADCIGARVIALEPARGMRREARQRAIGPTSKSAATPESRKGAGPVLGAGARAEQLPLRDASCDLAWMSNVLHHVVDLAACARELRRVLRPGAALLIRSCFADRLESIAVYRYFPEARRFAERFPTLEHTRAVFETAGLATERVSRVFQPTAASLRDLAQRTRHRADSTLELLSDAEFARGQAAIERAARREVRPRPVIEPIDLMILR